MLVYVFMKIDICRVKHVSMGNIVKHMDGVNMNSKVLHNITF